MTTDFPPIAHATLDAETLGQLLFDIEHAAELVGISIKPLGHVRAEPSSLPRGLDEVHRALVTGTVAGVQLRYRHRGEEWWDTLSPTSNGWRLVRINHTHTVAAADL
jgi:hypothetical protein